MTNSRKLAHNHYYHIFPRQSILEFQLHIATHSTLNKIIIIITTFVFSNNNAMCVFLSLSHPSSQSTLLFFFVNVMQFSLSLSIRKRNYRMYICTHSSIIFFFLLFLCVDFFFCYSFVLRLRPVMR